MSATTRHIAMMPPMDAKDAASAHTTEAEVDAPKQYQ